MTDDKNVIISYAILGTKHILSLTKTEETTPTDCPSKSTYKDIINNITVSYKDLDKLELDLLTKSIKYNFNKFKNISQPNDLCQLSVALDIRMALCTDDRILSSILSELVNDTIESLQFSEDKSKFQTEVQHLYNLITNQLQLIHKPTVASDVLDNVNGTLDYYGIQLTESNAQSILHITHDDTDALGCATLLNSAFGAQNVTHMFVPADDKQRLEKIKTVIDVIDDYKYIYITDIQLKDEHLPHLRYAITSGKLVWVDHHLSNCNKTGTWYNHKVGSSASAILFDMLKPQLEHKANFDNISQYIKGCNDWDTWAWTQDETMYGLYIEFMNRAILNASVDMWETKPDYDVAMQILDETLSVGRPGSLEDMSIQSILKLYGSVSSELDNVQSQIDDWIANYNKVDVCGIPCAEIIVNTEEDICYSLQCHLFLDELRNSNSEIQTVYVANTETDKLSIRTYSDNIDVGEMCTLVGGGGHQKAAGCKYSDFKQYYISPTEETLSGIKAFI